MSSELRLLFGILAVLTVLLIGTVGYMVLEEMPHTPSFADAAYMTVITVSTVGYGEVWPLSPRTRTWTIAVITVGIGTVSYAFTSLFALVVGGELRSERERKKLMRDISHLGNHVVLCGYGRTGSLVVQELSKQGFESVVIENDEDKVNLLRDHDVLHIDGDATSEETLLQAGLMQAAALVATLPNDADNVYITLTANAIKPDLRIIARAELPSTEGKLRRAGASQVICPHIIGARKMAALLTRPNVVDFVETVSEGVELELDEYRVGEKSSLNGKTLRNSRVRDITGGSVVAICRPQGETLYNPDPDSVFDAGDTLILVGPSGISKRLKALEESNE